MPTTVLVTAVSAWVEAMDGNAPLARAEADRLYALATSVRPDARGGLGWLRRHTRGIQIFGGVLLILVGLALVTGGWNEFVSWVRDAFVSDVRLPL